MTHRISFFAAVLCASTALAALVPAAAQTLEEYQSRVPMTPSVAAQTAKRAAQIAAVRQREAQALAAQRERDANQDRAEQQRINPLDPPPDGIYQDVWDRMSAQDKADWAEATPQDKALALQFMRQMHRNDTPSTPNTAAQNAFLAWCQNPDTLAAASQAIEGAASTTEPVRVLRIYGAALASAYTCGASVITNRDQYDIRYAEKVVGNEHFVTVQRWNVDDYVNNVRRQGHSDHPW